MKKPKPGKRYFLVRIRGEQIEAGWFERFDDGSATARTGGFVVWADCDPRAWKKLWDRLASEGFQEVSEAKRAGVIPTDWQLPSEYVGC